MTFLLVEYHGVDLTAVESGIEAVKGFRREERGMKLDRKLVRVQSYFQVRRKNSDSLIE